MSRLLTITRRIVMPLITIHPGEHLAEELKALDMSAAELARRLDVPTNRITQILNGTRAITADTALRLARSFGTSAEFWMDLQTQYDLGLARESAAWSGPIPTKDNQVLGAVALYSPESRLPTDEDLALTEGAGPTAPIAIERQRSQEGLQ